MHTHTHKKQKFDKIENKTHPPTIVFLPSCLLTSFSNSIHLHYRTLITCPALFYIRNNLVSTLCKVIRLKWNLHKKTYFHFLYSATLLINTRNHSSYYYSSEKKKTERSCSNNQLLQLFFLLSTTTCSLCVLVIDIAHFPCSFNWCKKQDKTEQSEEATQKKLYNTGYMK